MDDNLYKQVSNNYELLDICAKKLAILFNIDFLPQPGEINCSITLKETHVATDVFVPLNSQ